MRDKQPHWIVCRLWDIDESCIHYWLYPLGYIYSESSRFLVAYNNLLMKRRQDAGVNPITGESKYKSNMTLLAGCNLTGGYDEG